MMKLKRNLAAGSTGQFSKSAIYAAIFIRFVVEYGLIRHAFSKKAAGIEYFAASLCALGILPSEFMSWATMLAHLICGITNLLAAFVSAEIFPIVAIRGLVMFYIQFLFGFSLIKP